MARTAPDGAEAIRGIYRDRVVFALAIAGVLFFLPFAVNNFLQDRIALGIGTTGVVLILAVDALALRRGKRLPVPLPAIFIPIVLSLPISVRTLGFIGMLWCYPAVLLFFFVLTRRTANWFATAVVFLVTPLVVQHAGVPTTVRFSVTLILVIVFSNIFLSIIEALHKQLAEQAVRDPLTGTYNRRHMEQLVGAVVAASRPSAASLLIIDIDHFKLINDLHGHAVGDQVLRRVARAVSEHHSSSVVFRIGGEEFVMLLQGQDMEDAIRLAEDLRLKIATTSHTAAGTVTVSIGVSELRRNDTPDHWFKRADDALYEAKRSGRNRVVASVREGSGSKGAIS